MQQPKRLLVAGVLIRDSRVLVVDNIKRGVRTEFPGGKVEPGEELETAIKRELLEEVGVGVRVIRELGVYETDPGPEGTFDVHLFYCEIVEGEPTEGLEPTKTGAFHWLTADELSVFPTAVFSARNAAPDIATLIAQGSQAQ